MYRSKFILTGVKISGNRKRCSRHSVFDAQVSVLPGHHTVLTKVWVRARGIVSLYDTGICSCCFTGIAMELNSLSHEVRYAVKAASFH